MRNLLFNADHPFGVLHVCFGNVDAESLELGRSDETGIDSGQGVKSADHESGADQQDERQRDLDNHEHTARPMPLAAFAHGTSALTQPGSKVPASILQD